MRAIITYHSLDESGSPISIPPVVFRSHADWFASGRVRVVGVTELLELSDSVDAVALTFDDGFANFESHAMPVLSERGLSATVFVVTGHVGGKNLWGGRGDPGIPVLHLLDWDAIGRLSESGIEFGAHTRTHPHLPALSGDQVEDEMGSASDEIQHHLGKRPRGFAYPYGAVDARVAQAAARHYDWSCTTELRSLRRADSRELLPRLDAFYFKNPSRLHQWGSTEFRAWIWARRQGRRVRHVMRKMGMS
jgi:peptidoglycan/xylan/chitin deacetylase (PgdA/CDA1 family)